MMQENIIKSGWISWKAATEGDTKEIQAWAMKQEKSKGRLSSL